MINTKGVQIVIISGELEEIRFIVFNSIGNTVSLLNGCYMSEFSLYFSLCIYCIFDMYHKNEETYQCHYSTERMVEVEHIFSVR